MFVLHLRSHITIDRLDILSGRNTESAMSDAPGENLRFVVYSSAAIGFVADFISTSFQLSWKPVSGLSCVVISFALAVSPTDTIYSSLLAIPVRLQR